ncbi:MAG: putative Nudix hydrolase NudL [Anaerolineales bacterium]|nr:putative Nudix hydrolase NudL [Anaerolineales bacterium]
MFESLTEAEISARLAAASSASNTDGYAETSAPPDSLKCAAVLVPLLRLDREWHLLFTRRTDRVESHKGQVSFPGGACDADESTPEQTALREAEEEIGLHPNDVRVLGRLAPMTTISSFRVTPVVGVIEWPVVFRPAQAEVARVFTMPLKWLADRSNRWEFNLFGRNHSVIFFHPHDGELLWGATAIMTVEFLNLLTAERQA